MPSDAPAQPPAATALDHAYNARDSVDTDVFNATMARYAGLSAQCRATLPCRLDLCYDEASGQRLDLFADPHSHDQPLLVFIHGGYWRMLSKEDSSFMAANLAQHGIATAALDYALAPAASLETIVAQVRSALVWLYQHAREYGLDPERIVVAGSSAGGHLAATLLDGAWRAAAGLPETVPHGALLISGLFDLRPVRETFANAWLQLDAERAAALSPIDMLPATPVPTVLAWGEHEPSGFKTQAANYLSRCRAQWPDIADTVVRGFEVPARHHFDVLLDLCDPSSTLSAALLELYGMGRA